MKYILISLGIITLALGILGIFLPILPTTPFLLLSATVFARSSKDLYNWLVNHKVLGKYVKDFLNEKTIPLRIKIYSISLLWASIMFSVFFAVNDKAWLQLLLLIIAVGVTTHILSYKTKNTEN
jgi:uncharacterized membrane protein YbaN (DUF454 family)